MDKRWMRPKRKLRLNVVIAKATALQLIEPKPPWRDKAARIRAALSLNAGRL